MPGYDQGKITIVSGTMKIGENGLVQKIEYVHEVEVIS